MKNLIILFVSILAAQISIGQGVGIGTADPDSSAALEVSSTTQGMLVPRMTTAQRTLISSPATGLLVFDITTNSFWFKGGPSWVELVDSVNTEVHRSGPNTIYAGMTDNVGIGTTTPGHKLEVKTGQGIYGISHTDGTVDVSTFLQNDPWYAAGYIGTKSNHPLQLYANDGYNQFVLTPSGNIGIGVLFPNAPLQFNNNLQNRKIVLYQGANNNHQYSGFGINGGLLRYQSMNDHAFYHSVDSTSSTELMRIKGNGNVGIGVPNPSAMLEIERGSVVSAPFGSLQVNGTTFDSHFNYGTPEDTYIRGGKAGAKVIINDLGGLGNVGIGTANPLQKLHVGGSLVVDNKVGIGTTTPAYNLQVKTIDNNYGISHTNGTIEIATYIQNDAGGLFGTKSNHPFQLYANDGFNQFTLMPSGNVGIGTAIPGARLEITRGTVDSAPFGSLQVNGTFYHSHFSFGAFEDTYICGGKPGAKVIINEYSDHGNVGIGTSNPLQKLHVGGNVAVDGNVGIGVTSPGGTLEIARGTASGGSLWINGTTYPSHFSFGASEDTYIRGGKPGAKVIINDYSNLGNVGIGTANPSATLEIARGTADFGTLQINGTNHNSHFNYGAPETTYIRGGKPGANVIINELGGLGNVGIGTATPTEKLDVNGNVDISGSLEIGYVRVFSAVIGVPAFSYGSQVCNCPDGLVAIGGGVLVFTNVVKITKSYASTNSTWHAEIFNDDIIPHSIQAFAVCARLAN